MIRLMPNSGWASGQGEVGFRDVSHPPTSILSKSRGLCYD